MQIKKSCGASSILMAEYHAWERAMPEWFNSQVKTFYLMDCRSFHDGYFISLEAVNIV
jgi:hypothetical protein